MTNIDNKNNAFTLAEVLITLGIIGVVAAMTIPTLMNNVNNMQNATAAKKAYAILSQATMLAANEQGGSLRGSGIYNTGSSKTVIDAFAPYLKFAKNCGNANAGGCFYSSPRYYLDGRLANDDLNGAYASNNWATAILADGAEVAFFGAYAGDCITDRHNGVLDVCGTMEVDVNGSKLPNKIGRDVFSFAIVADGSVYPVGTYETAADITADCSSATKKDGWFCAAKVVQSGKEDY